VWIAIPLCPMWIIWGERNNETFNGDEISTLKTLFLRLCVAGCWLMMVSTSLLF
jgi:hypothetical protein